MHSNCVSSCTFPLRLRDVVVVLNEMHDAFHALQPGNPACVNLDASVLPAPALRPATLVEQRVGEATVMRDAVEKERERAVVRIDLVSADEHENAAALHAATTPIKIKEEAPRALSQNACHVPPGAPVKARAPARPRFVRGRTFALVKRTLFPDRVQLKKQKILERQLKSLNKSINHMALAVDTLGNYLADANDEALSASASAHHTRVATPHRHRNVSLGQSANRVVTTISNSSDDDADSVMSDADF